MALKDILTQNDLAALNASLSQLAANLKIHVNETLSVAHGMNAIVAEYRDSSDDQWGNVVLVFDFGTPPDVVRLYVPAQITALGPASSGSGLVATGASSGSFSSPGIPLSNKPIVTVVTEDALNQASIYENMLLAHAATVHSDSGANQCHGGRTYTEIAVVDSLGHTVGRKYITLGINGTSWRVPCDQFSLNGVYGPPQTPTVNSVSAVYSGGSDTNGKWYLSGDTLYFVEGSNGARRLNFTLTYSVRGSVPMNYLWEWGYGSSWAPITVGVPFGTGIQSGTQKFTCTSGASGTVGTNPGLITTAFSIPQAGGSESITGQYIRLTLDSSGIGGGVTTATPLVMYLKYRD